MTPPNIQRNWCKICFDRETAGVFILTYTLMGALEFAKLFCFVFPCFFAVMDGRTGMMWQMVTLGKQLAVLPSNYSRLMWNGSMNTTLNFGLKTTIGTPGSQSSGNIVFTVDLRDTHRRAASTTAPVAVSTETNKHMRATKVEYSVVTALLYHSFMMKDC